MTLKFLHLHACMSVTFCLLTLADIASAVHRRLISTAKRITAYVKAEVDKAHNTLGA